MNAADIYSSLWAKVEKAEKEGKPQTAADYLKQLEAKAVAAGDELEQYVVAERLYSCLQQYNWKEANTYRYASLYPVRAKVLESDLDAYIEKYKDHPRVMILYWKRLCNHKSDADRKYNHTGEDYRAVRAECRELLAMKPSKEYREKIQNMIDDMDSQSIYIAGSGQVSPSAGVTLKVSSRNVSQAVLEVYRMDENRHLTYQYEGSADVLKKNSTLVSSRTICGFANDYNIEETRREKIEFPSPGVYVVRVSSGKQSSFSEIQVSDVAGALRIRAGKAEVYAADLMSGRPFGKVRVESFKNPGRDDRKGVYALKSRNAFNLALDGFTFADLSEELKDKDCDQFVRLSVEGDTGAPLMHLERYGYQNTGTFIPVQADNCAIFTDRALYKPGERVYFKIICYKSDGLNGEVLPNKAAEVTFRHSSSSENLDTLNLVTNDMGSASGFFTIPSDGRNGIYVISSSWGSASVRVEQYKRPSFSMSLPRCEEVNCFGDVVSQKGVLTSYAGYSVAGATVTYRVERSAWTNGSRYKWFPTAVVSEGRVTADASGCFNVTFAAERPEEADADDLVSASFRVEIKATDPQGETHEQSINIPVGDIPLDINVEVSSHQTREDRSIVDKSVTGEFTVRTTTLNGAPYAAKGNYEVIQDSVVRYKGKFTGNEPVAFDFAGIPSGAYEIHVSTEYRGRTMESTRKIVVIGRDDRVLPFKSLYFYYPIQTEGGIDFLLGTSEEDLYLEMETMDGHDRLSVEHLHLKNEMRRFTLPFKESYGTSVKITFFGIRNGEVLNNTYTFNNPNSTRFETVISSMRDKTGPNTRETITFNTKPGSESVVSIYDVTSDRYGENSFRFNPLYTVRNKPVPYITTTLTGFGGPVLYEARMKGAAPAGALNAMVMADTAVEEESMEMVALTDDSAEVPQNGEGEEPEAEVRQNLGELLGFFPHIRTAPDGTATVEYETGELLSTFRVLIMSHDRNLKTGSTESSVIVQKPLMVVPSVPLFVREGDRIVLKAKIVNMTDRELKGTARIQLTDGSGKALSLKGLKDQKINLLAGAQAEAAWEMEVPAADRISVKIWYSAGELSDGEVNVMTVEPSAITLTEAASFLIGGPHSYKYYEKQLQEKFGAKNPKIVRAEYSTLDAVKESLPAASAPAVNNAINWIQQLYINQMRGKVPGTGADEAFRSDAVSHIRSFQAADGGLRWFSGMGTSVSVTLYFLEKMSQLRQVGAVEVSSEESAVISAALKYVDSYLVRAYSSLKPKDVPHFAYVTAMSVRSQWLDYPMGNDAAKVFRQFLSGTEENWQKISILQKAGLIRTLQRCEGTEFWEKGFSKRIKALAGSLADYAVENPTVGCYFPNAVMPFRGLMNSEIYAHSQLIEVFSALGQKKMVDGIAQWLLLQKHNQAWENTVATTDAVHALIASNAKDLRFGAVYYTYTTTMDKVKASASEITVSRQFIRESDGAVLNEGDHLKVGDKIIARYTIHNTENRSFVEVKAMRPACFYLEDERSGYSWWGGCYRDVKESYTSFYYDLLPEETTAVEEVFFVQQEGTFTAGIVEAVCLYAQEYRGHTDSRVLQSDSL